MGSKINLLIDSFTSILALFTTIAWYQSIWDSLSPLTSHSFSLCPVLGIVPFVHHVEVPKLILLIRCELEVITGWIQEKLHQLQKARDETKDLLTGLLPVTWTKVSLQESKSPQVGWLNNNEDKGLDGLEMSHLDRYIDRYFIDSMGENSCATAAWKRVKKLTDLICFFVLLGGTEQVARLHLYTLKHQTPKIYTK